MESLAEDCRKKKYRLPVFKAAALNATCALKELKRL